MRYLVDSDQIIWYLKGKPEVIKTLQDLEKDLVVSVISVAEVAEGIFGYDHEKELMMGLENLLSGVAILDINREIAFEFAKLRSNLRKQGKLIDNFDLLIAATCLYHNLTLITENKRDFARIKILKIL